MLNGHLLTYNDTWDKIDEMLYDILSQNFKKYPRLIWERLGF